MPSNIKAERVRINLKQEDLARLVGVNRETIKRWERDIDSCKASNIKRLCRIFNVSSDYLIGLEERATR